MAPTKVNVALFGVLLCLQLTAGRIISFHAPSALPAPVDPFRIVIPDGAAAPSYAALTGVPQTPSEPAPVREEQNDIPPPRRVLPPAPPQMVNPPAFAAEAAAAYGFAAVGPVLANTAPVTQAPNPALPTPPPGVVQVLNSVVPNGGARIVEPPPAIVPPPDAVAITPLRDQAAQLLAQGYTFEQAPAAPGAALRPSAPRLTVPTPQQSYASNFGAFSSGIPAEGAPLTASFAAPLTASFAAPVAPLVAASPLSRQSVAYGQASASVSNDGLQITHHPGHGDGGATSYSSSSFSSNVQ